MADDVMSKHSLEALLIEKVGEKLAFNQAAYGTPWSGEGEDTRFLVAGAAEEIAAMVNHDRARLYRAVTDGLMEIADELDTEAGDDVPEARSPGAAAIREAVDNVYAKLYFEVALPRCAACGSQVGTHHGPGCEIGESTKIGASVITGLVTIEDCLVTEANGA